MGLKDFVFKFPNNNQNERSTSPTRGNPPAIGLDRMPPSPRRSSFNSAIRRKQRYTFTSYRLTGDYVQSWAGDKRLKRTKYGNMIVYGFIVIAAALCGYVTYDGAKSAKTGDYCLIMEDHFENSDIDSAHWSHEVQIGGFGTGSFDWTTSDKTNSFTDKDGLHINPTLTTETTDITEAQMYSGYTLNLTKAGGDGSCTSSDYKQCSIKSNSTTGAIINPVRSARLTTKGKKFIKYGRVEVVAKMPAGDWLWPAIWMMPEDSVYGAWPASGEIDIAELRGNPWQYPLGRDAMLSTLHWGPSSNLDGYWSTYGTMFIRRTDYSKGYHTYGLQWSKDYMFMYLDSRLKQVFYIKFGESKTLWDKGNFASATVNGSMVENPWKKSRNPNAPFDQTFYLILNVAVGAQNGWFYDGKYNKPWVDGGATAARDFIKAKDEWLPTWGEGNDRGMTVKSVKMWQEGKC